MASLDPGKLRLLRKAAEPRPPRGRWVRLDDDDRAALAQLVTWIMIGFCIVALLLLAALTAGLMVRIFESVVR